MLTIVIEASDLWDELNETFIAVPGFTLQLEHSLVSLSKWEAKFEKPFLDTSDKTREETLGYVEAMLLTEDYPPDLFDRLTSVELSKINDYIQAKHTATTFREDVEPKRSSEKITSELIYYWMTAFQIPFEAERWHLNNLMALIRVCNVKSQKPKKQSRAHMAQERRRINEERRAKLGTNG